MKNTNTKAQEYKRMLSRLKAINTYFNNQLAVAETLDNRIFCNIAIDNIGAALRTLEESHGILYGANNDK